MKSCVRSPWSLALLLCAGLLLTAPAAQAQPFFSVDFQGPTGFLAGDVLLPGPAIVLPFPFLGIVPSPLTGFAEVDALSFGMDRPLQPNQPPRYFFSVDEFAGGIPGAPAPPNVTSDGAFGPVFTASGSIFLSLGIPPGPFPPGPIFGNRLAFAGAGLGLVPVNPPTPGLLPDPGDNLDALNMGPRGPRVYYSLDAAYPDPLEIPPANSGTAIANAVFPGDILVGPAAAPIVFAPFFTLGLGPQDDLDALILWENGSGVYEPSPNPYDWIFLGTDMVLFSVRRGSPIIGTPDFFFGMPIEEGDILIPTNGGGTPPGIFTPAEALGLITLRSGFPPPFFFGDDLDALSFR